MFLNRIFQLIYYLSFYAISINFQIEVLKKCAYATSSDGTTCWKYTKWNYTKPEDLCLKCNEKILIRACGTSTDHWVHDNTLCPDDLLEIRLHHNSILCLKISRTIQPYNENICYGSNTIIPMDLPNRDISKVLQFLIKKNISEYWLPIRRENAFMPFVVRLPGKLWKTVINQNLIKSVKNSDEHCLKHAVFKENKYQNFIFTENCTTPLNIVCAFISDFPTSSGCSERLGGLVQRPIEGYGFNRKKCFDKHFQSKNYLTNRNLLKVLLSKDKNNQDFFIIHNLYDIFGNKCIILSCTYNIVHVVNESLHWFPSLGKNMIGSTSSTEIKMILKMEEREQKLTLMIYNRKYLFLNKKDDIGVKCFTYTAYGILRNAKAAIIWENEEQSRSIYQVSLVSNYSSEYWCEGHSILNFQFVTTRKIAVYKNLGHDFVLRWKVSCIHKNKFDGLCEISRMGPIQMVNIVCNHLKKIKYMSVFDELKIHQVRVMNIKWKLNKFFVYWIHITATWETKEVFDEIRKLNQYIKNDFYKNSNMRKHITDTLQAINKYTKNWTIRNTEYCYPERVFSKAALENHWMETRRGEKGTTKILCLQHNGMPYTRLCQGDFIRGAYWNKLTQPVLCDPTKNLTNILIDMYNSKFLISEPEEVLKKMINVIEKNKTTLIAADVHIISNIIKITFKRLTSFNTWDPKTNADTVTWKNAICKIINVYNSVTDIKPQVLRMSAKLNSTNILLESFEQSVDTISTMSLLNDKMSGGKETGFVFKNEIIDYQDIGVSAIISKNLLYFLINPSIANVSGIALFSKNSSRGLSQKYKGSFINENYRFLQSNHDISDFFGEPNLQIGVYLPKDLLRGLSSFSHLSKANSKSVPLIVIKVYSNDKLFQQTTGKKTISSRIISISVPRYNTNLPIPIPLIIRRNKRHNLGSSESCYYWNYGHWANDGITMINKSKAGKDIVLCSLRHLSHFAYIVGHKGSSEAANEKKLIKSNNILDLITIAGCVIIFTGMCCIFMTVSKFGL